MTHQEKGSRRQVEKRIRRTDAARKSRWLVRRRELTVEGLEERCLLAVITVTVTPDFNTRDTGLSLREAIQISNGTLAISALNAAEQALVSGTLTSPNTIAFNIPGSGVRTIATSEQLPTITSPVIIDGYTQPGSQSNTSPVRINALPMVQILIGTPGPMYPGLTIAADDCTVQGLVVNRFSTLVRVQGSRNIIRGNFLGTDPAGLSNQLDPSNPSANSIGLSVTGTSNLIGGTTPAARNLISGNQNGDLSVTGNGNVVQGNFIGPDITGNAKPARMRASSGLAVSVDGSGNVIGGTTPGAGNVISTATVLVQVTGTGHRVEGNLIGFDPAGTTPIGVSRVGVSLTNGAINNTIGGTAEIARNLISARGETVSIAGILIDGGTTTGNAVKGNTIRDSTAGIWIRNGANNNTIGGSEPGAGNFIFGNGRGGIVLSAGQDQFELPTTTGVDPTGNTIRGNAIIGNTVPGAPTPTPAVGIDLYGGSQSLDRRTENSPGGPHVGPNLLQNYPVLQTAIAIGGVTTITGILNSTPNASFTLDFYRLPASSGQAPVYTGMLTGVTTNAAGNASFSFPVAGIFGGQTVYATATDSAGNTSEYSLSVPVSGESLASTTSLTSSVNPSRSGDTTRVTAIVASLSGSGTPTGSVIFSIDGVPQTPVPLALVNGKSQATLYCWPDPGNRLITAVYHGDSFFTGSEATPLTQTVTTNIALDPLPATTQVGTPVTLIARVTHDDGVTPLAGALVAFNVVSGPDVGLRGEAATDSAGLATFSFFASNSPGEDTIQATYQYVNPPNFRFQASNFVSTRLQKVPNLSWVPPAPIRYGTPLTSAQYNVKSDVDGSFTYSPALGTVLRAGSGQFLTATFTPNNTYVYASRSITTPINVLKGIPELGWGRPAAIDYGTPLSATQLNASANVPGSFVYSPAAGTVLTPGQQGLSATFVPANTADYDSLSIHTAIIIKISLPAMVDDGAGTSQTGPWAEAAIGGASGSVRYAEAGTGSSTITWPLAGLVQGTYDVQVTWMAGTNRASNAPYRIYDGNTLRKTVRVDQRNAPVGATVGGVTFQSLGVVTVNSGTIRVALANDADNHVIADAIRITSSIAVPVLLDDDDSAVTIQAGPWVEAAGGGYGDSVRYAAAGDGSTAFQWLQSGLAPNSYDVQVTWMAGGNRASNAPYRIYDGNTLLKTVRVDQRNAPLGTTVGGVIFQSLGVVAVNSGTIRIELANDADNYIIADAARVIAPVALPTVFDDEGEATSQAGPWVNVAGGGYDGSYRYAEAGDGSTAFHWPQLGLIPGSYDVQVTWVAGGNRASNAPYRIYDGNTLLKTVRVDQRIAPTGTTVGGVVFQSLGFVVVNSGAIRIELANDADNYIIADAVRVAAPVALPTVLDDEGEATSQAGPWVNVAGGGYGDSARYAEAGDGSTVFQWLQSSLPPNSYDVQVTWAAGGNRASNAPYRIYDGNTLLKTVRIDQRIAPVGTTVGGVVFQSLGTVTVNSGMLRVELANDANGFIIADAVRISTAGSLLAEPGPGPLVQEALLTTTDLPTLVDAALARWQAAGVDATRIQALRDTSIRITDLSGDELAFANGDGITLDSDAAGYGWFIDSTPDDDGEFTNQNGVPTPQGIDLLTVLEHEFGHLLGRRHVDDGQGLMARRLRPGVRWTV
ncbi:Ig-like domain repeat protein [Singulisphaera sp. Ch08]|uniref:Ig-like domain repeat protein n=1 Tax=Singulisphaera sp. Ch08 TaxID=3120278 RepID=A0AAU7C7Y0_9BACT